MSSKIVIDATRQLPDEGGPPMYPERNRDLLAKLAPESFDLVKANWEKYLDGWKPYPGPAAGVSRPRRGGPW
jgi:hypothetical protein